MIGTDYHLRFYRQWDNPRGLSSTRFRYRETDLLVHSNGDVSTYLLPFVIKYRHQIEETIKNYPEFKTSLNPLTLQSPYPLIRKMISVSSQAGVGPMAGVAGGIAEFVGRDLLKFTDEIIVENGGDIFIKTNRSRTLLIYAGEHSPFKEKLRLKLPALKSPYGICTSSRYVGHSRNFGKTDATVVVARSALVADVYATSLSNMVSSKEDIQKAIDVAMNTRDLTGIIILIENNAGVWGDIEFL